MHCGIAITAASLCVSHYRLNICGYVRLCYISKAELDVNELIDKFKTVYKQNGRYDTKSQVPYLSRLAEIYVKRSKTSSLKWVELLKVQSSMNRITLFKCCLYDFYIHSDSFVTELRYIPPQAHALYNSCYALDGDPQWQREAFSVQRLYWDESIHLSYSDQGDLTESLKMALGRVRERVRSGLTESGPLVEQLSFGPEDIRSEKYNKLIDVWISNVKSLSSACNKDMIDFASKIIKETVNICGPPPCEFACVGIGSIARGETTPYSDLEYLFLVKDVAHECYFERLAVTTYFLIGNLGETKLKYMNIEELAKEKWFEDESKNGFKIDGLSPNAGNIPTGNGSEKRKNKFITTTDDLVAEYERVYRTVPDRDEALKGDLSAMLASTVLLYGSEMMVDEFKCRTAAIDATEARRSVTQEMLAKDEQKFLLEPDKKLAEKIELKDQIYRYPTILLFDMKICFKLCSSQCWSVINELVEENMIAATVGKDLDVLVATALFIRLSAYTHYESQNNNITIWTADMKGPETGVRREMWTVSKSLLQLFFTHLLPVKNSIRKLAQAGSRGDEDMSMEQNAFYNVGLTLFYCEDYDSFLTLTEKAPELCTKTEDWKSMRLVALGKTNRFNEASEFAHEMLSGGNLSSECEGGVYNELGLGYFSQGEYAEALKYFCKSLAIQRAVYGDSDHPAIATSYNNIGSVYQSQGEYAKALECYNKSLHIGLAVYGDSNHPRIATSYGEIGLVYYSQGEYAKALELYDKSLAIKLSVYGDSNHPDIAASYGKMGCVYRSQGEYAKALECHNKSLDIRLAVYGNSNHPDIATSYSKIGSVYYFQGEYVKALKYYHYSLAIGRAVYGDSDHPAIATSYSNIAPVYSSLGEYAKARKCSDESKTIRSACEHK